LLAVQVVKGEPKPKIEMVRTGMHLEIQRARRKGPVSLSYQLHYKRLANRVNPARENKSFSGTNNGGGSSVYITKQHASARFPCPPTQAFRAGAQNPDNSSIHGVRKRSVWTLSVYGQHYATR
jgi:hypothetical protein